MAAVLSRLGSPAELAAAAGPADAAPRAPHATTVASLRRRLAHVRGRTWGVLGAIVVLAGIATGCLVYHLTLDSLGFEGASGWWYPQDYNHEVTTTAGGVVQTAVPLRSGERQGYFAAVHNPAAVTQTIPGQIRLVRVLWTSDGCSSGGTSSVDTLALRVRAGWFTRTEIIQLGQAWAVTGTSHGP